MNSFGHFLKILQIINIILETINTPVIINKELISKPSLLSGDSYRLKHRQTIFGNN
jgi:hypothetical protein